MGSLRPSVGPWAVLAGDALATRWRRARGCWRRCCFDVNRRCCWRSRHQLRRCWGYGHCRPAVRILDGDRRTCRAGQWALPGTRRALPAHVHADPGPVRPRERPAHPRPTEGVRQPVAVPPVDRHLERDRRLGTRERIHPSIDSGRRPGSCHRHHDHCRRHRGADYRCYRPLGFRDHRRLQRDAGRNAAGDKPE